MTNAISLAGLRVLVVEDEAIISMMLEDFLDELGCNVVAVAARLEEAISKASTVALDIAVLDINLAGQQSYPVADILRTRNIPFVFATGYGVAGVPAELRQAPVLSKPFKRAQLAKVLSDACGAQTR